MKLAYFWCPIVPSAVRFDALRFSPGRPDWWHSTMKRCTRTGPCRSPAEWKKRYTRLSLPVCDLPQCMHRSGISWVNPNKTVDVIWTFPRFKTQNSSPIFAFIFYLFFSLSLLLCEEIAVWTCPAGLCSETTLRSPTGHRTSLPATGCRCHPGSQWDVRSEDHH